MVDLAEPVLVERYRILAKLGSGGMGEVYLAQDADRGCPVAIKMLSPPSSGDHKSLEQRFQREAESLIRLKHPNVVSFYDLVDEGETPFIVMQYVEGQSLAELLDTRQRVPLPLAQATQIVKEVGRALHFAHTRQVYHRDIKPSNVMVDSNGTAYLTDFNTALLKDRTRLTTGSEMVGTPSYAAPEQLRSEEIDARTDVYGLGILLYEMLTGESPFDASSSAFVQLVLTGSFAHPRQTNPDIPPAVEQVILRAMSASKQDRYPSVKAMLDTLEAIERAQAPLAGRGTPPGQPTPSPKADRTPRALYGLLAVSVGTNLVLLVAIAAFLWFGLDLSSLRSGLTKAEPSATLLTVASSTPTAVSTLPPSPSPSPTATPTVRPTTTPAPTSTPSPTPVPTSTATPSPTPFLLVSIDQLEVYSGPGEDYILWGEIRRGDRLILLGRSADGQWWQIDYLGREGWIQAQTSGASADASDLPLRTAPPKPETTPEPEEEETDLPKENTQIALQNPGFEGIQESIVPGWRWWAEDNTAPGQSHDSETSYETPLLKQADDPARMINGSTLQIDGAGHLKFRAHIFQTVSVQSGTKVRLQVLAGAYADVGDIRLAAGIDPDGGSDCRLARWGSMRTINQSDGIMRLESPDITVGTAGRVTVCLYAEPVYAARSSAAFFDDAELTVIAEQPNE